MGVDEVGTLDVLRACRRELIDPAIAARRGRISGHVLCPLRRLDIARTAVPRPSSGRIEAALTGCPGRRVEPRRPVLELQLLVSR